MQVTIIPIVIVAFGTVTKGTGGFGSWRTSGDHPNYYIIENGQNAEKSPGDLRRLAVTQTSVKNHRLTLMLKALIIIMTRSNRSQQKKGNLPNSGLYRPGRPPSKTERKRKTEKSAPTLLEN